MVNYGNFKQQRSVKELIGTKCHFATTAGIFKGTISAINENFSIYELQDVIYYPFGNLNTQINMKICEIYSQHIVASLPVLD